MHSVPVCVKNKSVLSVIFHATYGAVCIRLTHLTCDDFDYTCTLYHCHHQIECMTHWPLFRVRSWNKGMRFMSFYILSPCNISSRKQKPRFHQYSRYIFYSSDFWLGRCTFTWKTLLSNCCMTLVKYVASVYIVVSFVSFVLIWFVA